MPDRVGHLLPSNLETATMEPTATKMSIPKSSSIIILTGAGISKESGLETFRDTEGLWSKVRVEDVATPQAFHDNPARVHAFYNARRKGALEPNVQPNGAHEALARLEREWPGDVLLITQNIDDLHERAGSKNLIHMHGELLKAECLLCAEITPWREDMSVSSVCPHCQEAGHLRVNVVWFGEMPIYMDRIHRELNRCELFISVGTSGNVYPAAGFVQQVSRKAKTVELNLERSENANQFTDGHYGPATKIVPAFVEQVLGSAY